MCVLSSWSLMAYWVSLHLLFLVIFATITVNGDKFQVRWFNDNNNFKAGDTAIVMIKLEGVHGDDDNPGATKLNRFKIILNGKEGNSTFISGIGSFHDAVSSSWNITFVPILAGSYLPIIEDRHTGISDASLNFSVSPGEMYPSVCVGFWTNYVNEFTAGEVAKVSILPKDAFGNNITQVNKDHLLYKFVISMVSTNGSSSDLSEIFNKGLDDFGYLGIEFKVVTSGNFTLYIVGGNQTLNGFPLPFSVISGPLDIAKCSAIGKYEANALQIFSNLEVFIYQKDQFDNVVSGQYDFDVEIVEKASNLSVPVSDLQFKEVGLGIQLLTFSVFEPGDFVVTIYDPKDKESAFSMRYHYNVFIGYTHGLNSVVNGTALSSSVAGEVAYLFVYLHDIYFNPSPIEVQWLRVVIIKKSDSSKLQAMVAPIRSVRGEREPAVGTPYLTGGKALDPFTAKNISNEFSVMYNPIKSGSYDIWVFGGNIPLNGGRPYTVEVSPDRVDTSTSRVLTYAPKVLRLIRNEVTMQLMDRFSNHVTSQQSKLSFDFGFTGGTLFLNWSFEDRGDGTYLGYYLAKDTGVFNISVLFEGEKLASCPFEINAYRKEYFPEAVNETIIVWENESIAFNVLENDHFPVGNRSIVNFSLPHHGSLIHQEDLFRYTPYKGFFGNDSFCYSIGDVNMNTATGTVNISVLISPPQFVSLPRQVIAIENKISLRLSGFDGDGFEIKYSDLSENISIHLKSEHGRLYFAPSPMQFWKPSESEFSINSVQEGKNLILVGRVQVLNHMLRLIQYLGDENFYGADNITFTMKNKHGEQFGLVPIYVKPINNPPFILVPEYIVLEETDGSGYSKLFDNNNQGEQIVGDPDYMSFPGDKSEFVVKISIEVNTGLVMTTLPAYLINTTELILESKYHWQPLLAFVAISKHVVVRGKGIRFYCTLMDCNNALQQLKFQGVGQAVLTMSVNDLGNYGCYFECLEDMSLPLQTQATINLVRTKPMKSNVAHLLGTMIIIEFISMILLGFSLLLFICKCARSLGYEKSSPPSSEIMLSDAQNFDKTVVQVDSKIQNG